MDNLFKPRFALRIGSEQVHEVSSVSKHHKTEKSLIFYDMGYRQINRQKQENEMLNSNMTLFNLFKKSTAMTTKHAATAPHSIDEDRSNY